VSEAVPGKLIGRDLFSGGILWFEEIGRNEVARVGGKGASLGELVRAGIRVPPGFVITTPVFTAFMDAADPSGQLRLEVAGLDADDLAAITRAGARLRERIKETPLSAELAVSFSTACAKLQPRNDGFAVRSSATSEDSDTASFAGLQDTYLWVPAKQVPDRIRACWASLYNAESIGYRRRLGIPELPLAMAVVVQAMVDASAAGVMFSRSPTTGDKSVVTIEASWGLGSSIVGGEVTPDKYIVNKVTGEVIDRVIASKAIRHVREAGGAGVRVEAVSAAQSSASCLDERQIAALVRIAKHCEQHYGCPQDMEWAVAAETLSGAVSGAASGAVSEAAGGDAGDGTGEDVIYLLQSRPETVWSRREAEAVLKPRAKAFEHVFAVLGGGDRK
jgi:pyruvate, water dikinase